MQEDYSGYMQEGKRLTLRRLRVGGGRWKMEKEREMGERKQPDYFTENMQESSHNSSGGGFTEIWSSLLHESVGKDRRRI